MQIIHAKSLLSKIEFAPVLPAGKRLYRNSKNCKINGFLAIRFQGAKQDCVPCELRSQCLRKPDKTETRQVAFFLGKVDGEENHTDRMKRKIDSDVGRGMITRRFATEEPVFGNLRENKRLDRVHPAGPGKGGWTMEAVRDDTQYRENGASWIWQVRKRTAGEPEFTGFGRISRPRLRQVEKRKEPFEVRLPAFEKTHRDWNRCSRNGYSCTLVEPGSAQKRNQSAAESSDQDGCAQAENGKNEYNSSAIRE